MSSFDCMVSAPHTFAAGHLRVLTVQLCNDAQALILGQSFLTWAAKQTDDGWVPEPGLSRVCNQPAC